MILFHPIKLILLSTSWIGCIALTACQPNSAADGVDRVPATSPSSAPVVSSPKPNAPTATPTAPQASNPTPSPVFRSLFPALKDQTKVPILLPTYVPEAEQPDRVYAILEEADAGKYQILLAFTEDCRGGTACRLGGVSGEVATPRAAVVSGKAVTLSNGIVGDFVDAKCGANCSDSTLTWDQDGYRYTMAIKAGKEATLVKMANSAIANGSL